MDLDWSAPLLHPAQSSLRWTRWLIVSHAFITSWLNKLLIIYLVTFVHLHSACLALRISDWRLCSGSPLHLHNSASIHSMENIQRWHALLICNKSFVEGQMWRNGRPWWDNTYISLLKHSHSSSLLKRSIFVVARLEFLFLNKSLLPLFFPSLYLYFLLSLFPCFVFFSQFSTFVFTFCHSSFLPLLCLLSHIYPLSILESFFFFLLLCLYSFQSSSLNPFSNRSSCFCLFSLNSLLLFSSLLPLLLLCLSWWIDSSLCLRAALIDMVVLRRKSCQWRRTIGLV